jgi:hypothetical protein
MRRFNRPLTSRAVSPLGARVELRAGSSTEKAQFRMQLSTHLNLASDFCFESWSRCRGDSVWLMHSNNCRLQLLMQT